MLGRPLLNRQSNVNVMTGKKGGAQSVISAVQIWNPDDWELFSLGLLQNRHGPLNVQKFRRPTKVTTESTTIVQRMRSHISVTQSKNR